MKIKNDIIKTMLLSTALCAWQAQAAAPFDPTDQPLGYIGPIELSTTDLSNGAKAYRGWFENGAWQGDLIEYSVSKNGVLSTSIDLTGTQPKQSGNANWSAHVQFAANAATLSHWDSGRKIITSTTGANQVAFRWGKLSAAQQLALDPVAAGANATSSDILDFIRGDRSNETPSGALRQRFSVMGDVIRSNPEYIAAPEGDSVDSSYIAFRNTYASRKPRVYVGANDGMLHAFDASNGNEVWAYVPSMLIDNLTKLAGTPYNHTHFVDGNITIRDAKFNGDWHSVLVGSLGAGGKGLFALDVTSPALSSENASTGSDKKILWELSAAGDDDMGHIFGATSIVQLNDDNWYAVNGNGVSSVNGKAVLLLVELGSGKITRLSTRRGSARSPNGLAAPALVDTNGDGKVDIAWAGDINGDMWRFDLTGSTPASWKVAYQKPLYAGSSAQPITLAPEVTRHPQYGHLVLFGTGRLYTAADIDDTTAQSLYGIWDEGVAPSGNEQRLAQLLSADLGYSGGGFSEMVRTFTTVAPLNYLTYKGWKVDLNPGERLLTPPQLRDGRLKTLITNPKGYDNWLLEVSFNEGGVVNKTIFDLDRNGQLNLADRVDANGNRKLDDLEDIPMGWEQSAGAMSQVTIASLKAGEDTMFLNFLNPPVTPPACVGSCPSGLLGGHMDVDTDKTLDGNTDGHVHEYDVDSNRTYVDFFDINPRGIDPTDGLKNVTNVVSNNEKFIVLLANADFSPGGNITIDKNTYNVVEYQRMIHKALAGWNGNPNQLKTPTGDPLVFTLGGIQSSGGELKISFASDAIIRGGLLPTKTQCVRNNDLGDKVNKLKKRWRNSALTLQLVKASHFQGVGLANGAALKRLSVQTPIDLRAVVTLGDGTRIALTEDLNGDNRINGNSPDFEIYGGLLANSNPEFLYEGVLFWHFSGTCYGDDPAWAQDFLNETKGFAFAVYDDLLKAAGFTDFNELSQYLASCSSTTCSNGMKRKDLKNLYDLGILVQNAKNSIGGGGGSGGITGTPKVISGGGVGLGVTAGPNFAAGRRTWIDILPE